MKLIIVGVFVMASVVMGRREKRAANVYPNRNFFTYDEIKANMLKLQQRHPLLTKRVEFGNKTDGGNTLYYQLLQVQRALFVLPNPFIVVTAGIDGDAHLSVGAAMAFMEKLVEKYEERDKDALEMMNNFDWIVIPVLNPDGYTKSKKGGWDRNWKKNTRRVPDIPSSNLNGCGGVSINMNFMFGPQLTDNQCDKEQYSGEKHFSEVESRALRDLAASLKKTLVSVVTVHDKGQAVVIPPITDEQELKRWVPGGKIYHKLKESERVGPKMAEAMSKPFSVKYTYGSFGDLFRSGTDFQGSAIDYFAYKIPGSYTFSIYLRPDKSIPDFIYPRVGAIAPAGAELYEGLKTLALEADGDYIDRMMKLPYSQVKK